MLEFEVKDFRELSSVGDSFVNLIYSLALTNTLKKPVGKRASNYVLSKALMESGFRGLAGKRVDRAEMGDVVEALIFDAWIKNKITLEASVAILVEKLKGSNTHKEIRDASITAFTALLKSIGDEKQKRVTLGLYNTYDNRVHDIHLRTIARAAPLCYSFDLNLALFGFPFDDPKDAVKTTQSKTTIGKGGEYLSKLDDKGRFFVFDFPKKGFPPQIGEVIVTTSKPDKKKSIGIEEIKLHRPSSCILMGLGRKGLPKDLIDMAKYHLELTGKNIPLETCTVIGMIPTIFR